MSRSTCAAWALRPPPLAHTVMMRSCTSAGSSVFGDLAAHGRRAARPFVLQETCGGLNPVRMIRDPATFG